jgi:hypothetical protein
MDGIRIGMWSGPRNISTALMRSWGSRDDTFVCDEPLYAHYLQQTGADHPQREEVIAAHETDWRKVVTWLLGPIPEGKTIFYQKHMAHHLLAHVDRDWVHDLRSVFLIREPREMLTSLTQVLPNPRVEETGLPQQWELFERVRDRSGGAPPVLDARDVLENPRGLLRRLCAVLDVPFQERMLRWEAGPRPTDGVWAPYWYANVERSTGFQPYRPKGAEVPKRLLGVLKECNPYYERLHEHRLTALDDGT